MDMAYRVFTAADEVASQLQPNVRHQPAASPVHADRAGYAPRRNPVAIAAVVLAHVVILYALIRFDVIAINRLAPQRLAVTMIEVAPPPPPHEQARVVPAPKIEAPLVAPPPLVVLKTPPPPMIAAPPPPEPVTAPPAPAAAAIVAPPAPGPVAVNIMADVLDAPPPRFPAESRRLRESGTVRLRVVVSTEGHVADITVTASSGFDRLDKAAIAAVRKWRFRARIVAGAAAEAVGFVPVTFNPPH